MSSWIRRTTTCVPAAVCAGLAGGPAPARAATLDGAGTLTYTAAPGFRDEVNFTQTAPNTVHVANFDQDAITPSGTCSSDGRGAFDCTGITAVSADGGDGNDFIDATHLTDLAASLTGSSGDDLLEGGDANDTLDGGDGNDSLFGDVFGGDDANTMRGGPGNDDMDGGPGNDAMDGGAGDDHIRGFGGDDEIVGGDGDDLIDARDGVVDRVQCGAGTDRALVDTLDAVSGDCESVETAEVGDANADRPTVAFTAPATDGVKIAPRGRTRLAATANGVKAVAEVRFIVNDRTVCMDATAPYTCDYHPRAEDVGRDTLSAEAIDSSLQTATARRTIIVGRFAPRRLTLGVKPEHSARRFTASGRLDLPAGVTAARGCSGRVAIQGKAGKRTIFRRQATLSSDCTFRQHIALKHRGRPPSRGVLRFTARYRGNAVLTPKTSRSSTVRAK